MFVREDQKTSPTSNSDNAIQLEKKNMLKMRKRIYVNTVKRHSHLVDRCIILHSQDVIQITRKNFHLNDQAHMVFTLVHNPQQG